MPPSDGEGRTLADYQGVLDRCAESKNLVLQGVWDALDYGPTFMLANGNRLRPLGRGVLLLRREDNNQPYFDLVSYVEVSGQVVTDCQLETLWKLN